MKVKACAGISDRKLFLKTVNGAPAFVLPEKIRIFNLMGSFPPQLTTNSHPITSSPSPSSEPKPVSGCGNSPIDEELQSEDAGNVKVLVGRGDNSGDIVIISCQSEK